MKFSVDRGTGLASLGAILFSAKAIVIKLAYRYGAHAELLLAMRMLLSMPFFAATLWWSMRPGGPPRVTPDRGDLLLILIAGVLGYYAASLLDFMGLEYISAGLERLILFTYPPIVLLISCALQRRWPGPRAVAGMLLSYAGLMLVYRHEVSLEGPQVALGALLVLASSLCYGVYLVLAGALLARLGTLQVTSLATLVSGAIILIQVSLRLPWSQVWSQPPEVWWLSCFNAVFCTVLPVFAVMAAMRRIGAARVAQIGMLGPVSTLLLGVLILRETFSIWHLAGTALVLGGIAVVQSSKGTKTAPAGSEVTEAAG